MQHRCHYVVFLLLNEQFEHGFINSKTHFWGVEERFATYFYVQCHVKAGGRGQSAVGSKRWSPSDPQWATVIKAKGSIVGRRKDPFVVEETSSTRVKRMCQRGIYVQDKRFNCVFMCTENICYGCALCR